MCRMLHDLDDNVGSVRFTMLASNWDLFVNKYTKNKTEISQKPSQKF